MRVELLGVRGSTPTPGASFVRFGGETSCVALCHDGDADPSLVLDAGTGLRQLSGRLAAPAYRGAIALSHLHWDHLQGLAFFAKGDHPQAQVEVLVPAQLGRSGRELLALVMRPPGFPIGPDGLLGSWRFRALEPGPCSVGGFELLAFDVAHKGGRTFGYRVRDGSGSLAYLPDHTAGARPGWLAQVLAGVDVLVHDAQFLAAESATARAYGHSTVEQAVELAEEAGVGRLVLFHHSPTRTDEQLDRIEESLRGLPRALVARDGMVLQLGGGLR